MNLELDPESDDSINELILGGAYHSPQEVIREAIALLAMEHTFPAGCPSADPVSMSPAHDEDRVDHALSVPSRPAAVSVLAPHTARRGHRLRRGGGDHGAVGRRGAVAAARCRGNAAACPRNCQAAQCRRPFRRHNADDSDPVFDSIMRSRGLGRTSVGPARIRDSRCDHRTSAFRSNGVYRAKLRWLAAIRSTGAFVAATGAAEIGRRRLGHAHGRIRYEQS